MSQPNHICNFFTYKFYLLQKEFLSGLIQFSFFNEANILLAAIVLGQILS